jgi:hypothetical protein
MVPESEDQPNEREVVEIDNDDIIDEVEDHRRREVAELFDDDPFADDGDLDMELESEPSW